jgi:hypothetical protein
MILVDKDLLVALTMTLGLLLNLGGSLKLKIETA